jgi:hypothetical protein
MKIHSKIALKKSTDVFTFKLDLQAMNAKELMEGFF